MRTMRLMSTDHLLVAGVSIGSTPYRDMVAARLTPLRDFLLPFFFLSIGASLDTATTSSRSAMSADR